MKVAITFLKDHKKLAGPIVVLQVLFFIGYFLLSSTLEKTQVFQEFDVLFELDPPRAINDLAVFSGDHHRTTVHPIYVLLTNPGGSLLHWIIDSEVKAALIVNAFWGALGVSLAFIFFYCYSSQILYSLLLALFFGCSMSQVLLSSVPDTASLAICSLLFTYILFLRSLQKKILWYKWWIVAGILTFGVTITNFAQTAICFAILIYLLQENKTSIWQLVLKYLRYGFWVLAFSVVLAGIQKLIYPSAGLFFLPNSLLNEKDFSTFLVFDHPFLVLIQEIKHFFIINFVAPFPTTYEIPDRENLAITFSNSWNYAKVGWIALGLWVGLLAIGVLACWQTKKMRPFFLGIGLCLLFNAALHSIYGGGEKEGVVEYFLYSGNFTFLALTFLSPLTLKNKPWIYLLLLALILLTGFNNCLVFREIIIVY